MTECLPGGYRDLHFPDGKPRLTGDMNCPRPQSVARAVLSPLAPQARVTWGDGSEGGQGMEGAALAGGPGSGRQAHRHGQVQRRVAVLSARVRVGPVGQQHHDTVVALTHHRHVQGCVPRGAGAVHVAASFQQHAGHLWRQGPGPSQWRARGSCGLRRLVAPGHCHFLGGLQVLGL